MQKTGNNNSKLLDDMVKAAEGAKPSSRPDMSKFYINVDSEPKPDFAATFANLVKEAQIMTPPKPMGMAPKSLGMDDAPTGGLGDGIGGGLDDGLGDEMGGLDNGLDDGLGNGLDEGTGDVESAKDTLAQALIDLCGGVDAATDILQSAGGGMSEDVIEDADEIPDLAGEEPFGEEPLGDPAAMPIGDEDAPNTPPNAMPSVV